MLMLQMGSVIMLVSPLVFLSAYASESQLAYALASQSASQSVYELAFPLV